MAPPPVAIVDCAELADDPTDPASVIIAAQLYSVLTLEECYAAKEQFAPYEPNHNITGPNGAAVAVGKVCFFRNCSVGAACGANPDQLAYEWFFSELDHHDLCGAGVTTGSLHCICHETRPSPPPPPASPPDVGYGISTPCPDAATARERPTYESECRHYADGLGVDFFHTYNPHGPPTGACLQIGIDGAPMPAALLSAPAVAAAMVIDGV